MNREAWEQRKKRDKRILAELRKGKSPAEVAKLFDLSPAFIRSAARPYGLLPTKQSTEQERQNILKDFAAGTEEKKIAAKYRRSLEGVFQFLRRNVPNYVPPESRKIAARNKRICQQYAKGKTVKELAASYKLNPFTIRVILKEAGVFKPLPVGRPSVRRTA